MTSLTPRAAMQQALEAARPILSRLKHQEGDAEATRALDLVCASLSSLAAAACWCRSCHADDVAWQMTHFVVCPDCGCKRCPRAESHEAACTGKRVPAHTPTGLTHTCSGCEENRARLNDAVQSASAPRGAAGEAPAHSKSEYKRRVAMGDPNVTPPAGTRGAAGEGGGAG